MERSDIQVLIDAIASGTPNTAATVRTVLNAIADGTAQTGDVKEIDVSNAYLTANFDASGLGTNERLGWAICNGNNGTRDRRGRVGIQYSASYPTLGATGGSKDAVVVQHSHTISTLKSYNNSFGTNGLYDRSQTASGAGLSTDTVGVDGADKNMQPYIVSLFIMKL